MVSLTEAAATVVAAAAHAYRVPALRVRTAGPAVAAPHAASEVALEAEEAHRLDPGEVAVTRGAAAVYLPSRLAADHEWALLDVAARTDSGSPATR
jgi:hypothetical protein